MLPNLSNMPTAQTGSRGQEDGFSLVELLVAVSIFVVITGMAVANFSGVKRKDDLKAEAKNLASNIRKVQNMAFAGQEQNGSVPSGGYGIYLNTCENNPCSYMLFADLNGNQIYDEDEELSGGVITMQGRVVISNLSPTPPVSISFKPPKPVIYIQGGLVESEATITLTDLNTSLSKTVNINRISGLVKTQ